MKKIALRVLAGFLGLIVLGILALVIKFYALSPKYRPATDVKAKNTPEAIARGKYLTQHVVACVGCHSENDETRPGDNFVVGRMGSGRDFGEMPGMPARLHAHNLTPDKETGLGNWTDGEILRAMREGVGKDNRALFPMMPYQTYAQVLSDDDALAIISYLRTIDPIKNDAGKTTINFPVSMFIRGAPAPVEKSPPPPPPASDKLARGKWLIKAALCNECHDSFNERREPIPGMALGGGAKFPLPNGRYAIAPNISSDKATGIGAYSDDDIKRVFEEGKGKDGRALWVMPWGYYNGMTAEDKDALVFALRQVAPVTNVVPPSKAQP